MIQRTESITLRTSYEEDLEKEMNELAKLYGASLFWDTVDDFDEPEPGWALIFWSGTREDLNALLVGAYAYDKDELL